MLVKRLNKFLLLMMAACSFIITSAQQQTAINAADINLSKQPLREKIYAHTDKDFYVAGEILWFKLYNVSADSLKPINLSNIAYIEILNTNQKPVLQATVALNNGSGNGSFYLTSSIASGNYILRAYTNWMKNFGAAAFFQKPITIVNTLTPLKKNADSDTNEYSIGFFPEGGNLVAGIQSKVGFKATDKYGNGIDCSGNIVDENNKTVAGFSTLKFGMGSFYFTPEANHTYTALVTVNGKKIEKPLPAVYNKGYVMHASNADNNNIAVTINSTEKSNPVYLIAYAGNNIKAALMQPVNNNGSATFSLNKNQLGYGMLHLIAFDSNRHPVGERLVFIKPKVSQIKVTPDNNVYDKRSEVKLDVASGDSANLSMSVYLLDSLQAYNEDNIASYLWLTSELKGRVEHAQYYLAQTNNEADSALENLLLTQGWSRFKTESTQGQPVLRFAPEHEGHIIEGRVTGKNSGMPAKNVRVYLSVPGKYYRFASAVSNDSGKVFFDIKDYYGSGEVVVQTAGEDSMYRVEIANPFSIQKSAWLVSKFDIDENVLQQLAKYNLAMQVQNAYSINEVNRFLSPAIDSNAFYGKPDAVYYLDNYTRFNTMEEVLREYIVGIDVRLKQGNYRLISIDPRNHNVFEENPLVLIDGVPVFDMNKLMAYNPLKIKKAEVLNRRYFINSLTAYGIVSYSTYKGDLDGFQFDPGTIELSYEGLQLQREFYAPQYATAKQKESRLPDYRTVLYWSPEVRPSTSLSFYTSDIKGRYVVVAEGLGADGKPVYGTAAFEVR